MRVLVVNAGSTTLKLRLLDSDDSLLIDEEIPAQRGRFDEAAAEAVIRGPDRIDAVGHRFVHGGSRLISAVRLDDEVEAYLRSLIDLAPLHQPAALEGVELLKRILPGVPAVACVDTAFHARMPLVAATYAIPREWRERYGLRRYGFHGLSHAYAARRTADLLGRSPDELRVITCHLGAGASLAAVKAGVSVDTTMGFTPLEGLVMATRSGTVDPGMLLWLEQHANVSPDALSDALEHRSGLVALAGTEDMRKVLSAARDGDPDSQLALDVYAYRLTASVAAMAAAMAGFDALVFTGGVGEHAAEVRAAAGRGLGFLGVILDEGRNAALMDDGLIGTDDAAVAALVVRAREDLEIARQVRSVLRLD
jgi:acetate kinase